MTKKDANLPQQASTEVEKESLSNQSDPNSEDDKPRQDAGDAENLIQAKDKEKKTGEIATPNKLSQEGANIKTSSQNSPQKILGKKIRADHGKIMERIEKMQEKKQYINVPECPVFRPSMEEFKDFSGYLEKCVPQVGDVGIFKVIPPKEWVPRKEGYNNVKFHVKKPIEQNVQSTNTRGVYELTLIEQMSRSIERFKSEAVKFAKVISEKSADEIEKLFWKSLQNSAPVYGADAAGSLFDDGVPWSLRELDTILTKGLGDQKIPGVTNPYLYIGSWKTMFGWHKEDMDLYAINYLHHGSPKQWYSINLEDNERFEDFMHYHYPENSSKCLDFIRHKNTLVHPHKLFEAGVRMVKQVHFENEFIIARASAYHAGFNYGFNIAEAVNFALPDWLPMAKHLTYCKCVAYSVNINIPAVMRNLGIFEKYYTKEEIREIEKKENAEQELKQPKKTVVKTKSKYIKNSNDPNLMNDLQELLGGTKEKEPKQIFKTIKVDRTYSSDQILIKPGNQEFDKADPKYNSQPLPNSKKPNLFQYVQQEKKSSKPTPTAKGKTLKIIGKRQSRRSKSSELKDSKKQKLSKSKEKVIKEQKNSSKEKTKQSKKNLKNNLFGINITSGYLFKRPDNQEIAAFELIQLIEQLQQAFRSKEKKKKMPGQSLTLEERLENLKVLHFGNEYTGKHLKIYQTQRLDGSVFKDEETLLDELLSLHSDTMHTINLFKLSEQLEDLNSQNTKSSKGDSRPPQAQIKKKNFNCAKCLRELELPTNIYNMVTNHLQIHRDIQNTQMTKLFRQYKGLKIPKDLFLNCEIPENSKLPLSSKRGDKSFLECYDLNVKNNCYAQKNHELLQRKERIQNIINNYISKQQKKKETELHKQKEKAMVQQKEYKFSSGTRITVYRKLQSKEKETAQLTNSSTPHNQKKQPSPQKRSESKDKTKNSPHKKNESKEKKQVNVDKSKKIEKKPQPACQTLTKQKKTPKTRDFKKEINLSKYAKDNGLKDVKDIKQVTNNQVYKGSEEDIVRQISMEHRSKIQGTSSTGNSQQQVTPSSNKLRSSNDPHAAINLNQAVKDISSLNLSAFKKMKQLQGKNDSSQKLSQQYESDKKKENEMEKNQEM